MRILAFDVLQRAVSNTVVAGRCWSRPWIHLCLLICLANASFASADEAVTYLLASGSTITVYYLDGRIVGPEPITGSFDWIGCGLANGATCFDATRLDFQSATFSIHLHGPNDLVDGVLFDGIPLFDEVVNAPGIVDGLAEMMSVYREGRISEYPEGSYPDRPWVPLSLEYPDLRIFQLGGGLYIGALEIRAVADRDHDGVPDDADECPETPAGAAVNQHGCSIDQLVPCTGPPSGGQWKNHGRYVSAVNAAVNQLLTEDRITQAQAEDVLTTAGRSDCGKR